MFRFLVTSIIVVLPGLCLSQDVIKTDLGEEIKARILKFNKKGVVYKSFEDPEFSTFLLPYNKLERIQYEDQKKPILCNKKLSRAYIGLSFGPSLALGSFGSTSLDAQNEPGFVEDIGVNASLEAGFYLWKNLGLSIGLGSSRFQFANTAYANSYNGIDGGTGFDRFEVFSTGNSIFGSNNQWVMSSAAIGPLYTIKLSRRFSWDLMARVAVVTTERPTIDLSYYRSTTNPFTNQSDEFLEAQYISSQSTNVDLSYQLGSTIRFLFSKRLSLFLAGHFTRTTPTLTIPYEVFRSTISGFDNEIYTVDTPYKISTLNLSLGLAFQFKRKGNKYE